MISRGFESNQEFIERTKKLQSKLVLHNIDGALITTKEDYHYFTGVTTQFWESPTRPLYLVIPNKSDPIAIIPSILKCQVENTWIKSIFTWDAPNKKDDGISLLLSVLKKFKTLGMSMNIESHLRMPLKHLQFITNELQLELIDISEYIQTLRLIKSPAEIAKIEAVCQITSECFEALPDHIEKTFHKKALSEREILTEMKLLLIKHGVDHVKYLVGSSGVGGYKSVILNPTDERIAPNSIFFMDTGTQLDEYFCDFNRNFVIRSHKECAYASMWRSFYNSHNLFLWNATELAIRSCKPGVLFSDLWKIMYNYLIHQGYDKLSYVSSRMGHSIGLNLTELPSVKNDEHVKLEDGMVITLEPYVQTEYGIIVHEEVLAITATGCKLLTIRAPKIPPVLFVE